MTLVFYSFQLQNTQKRYFFSKNETTFVFFTKVCNKTNIRALISKTKIVFLRFQPRKSQLSHFMYQIQTTLFFFTKFSNQTNWRGAGFRYDNIFFTFQPRKTQMKHFLFQIQMFLFFFFFFCTILQIDKFKAFDFKYDNSFLKFLAPKYPNNAFLVSE